jgi:hypothetical protein
MTCIVGIVHADGVTLGGDSAGVDVSNLGLWLRRDAKVFAIADGQMVLGFTSSFRMGDLLRYRLTLPRMHQSDSVDAYMRTSFIDAVRSCLSDGGYTRNDHGKELGGTFLVGFAGRLFRVEDDMQVGEAAADYDACGCGQSFALGALHALTGGHQIQGQFQAEPMLRAALGAAEQFSAGVRGPFNFVTAFRSPELDVRGTIVRKAD